ncbi:MAG: helix-turn-helix domain-containing protein [Bdellovibrionota bacterium]|nr:helix-turn-helix domain-containing protein [Bdellovibrionota bacterium]
MSLNFDDYYDLLQVDPAASLEEIQRAYRKTKALYSPDSPALYSMFSKEEATELIHVIETAYKTLSSPNLRAEYDQQRMRPKGAWDQSSNVQDDAIYGLSGESSGDFSNMDSNPSQSVGFSGDSPDLMSNVVEPSPQPTSNQKLGNTRFGNYVLDPEVEEYIQSVEVIDGPFLKTVREYKGVSIDQIASITKIGGHHLAAIENNDFSQLPPVVFSKAFVKQYAQLVGLDPQKCSDAYAEMMKKEQN